MSKRYVVTDTKHHFFAIGTEVYMDDQSYLSAKERALGYVMMFDHTQFQQALLPHQFEEVGYVDALDCECVSLEEAELENADADTVPAALRNYWVDEYAHHEVFTVAA